MVQMSPRKGITTGPNFKETTTRTKLTTTGIMQIQESALIDQFRDACAVRFYCGLRVSEAMQLSFTFVKYNVELFLLRGKNIGMGKFDSLFFPEKLHIIENK